MTQFIYIDNAQKRMSSLKKTIYNSGIEFSDVLGKSYVPWFVTLTYRRVDDFKKNHIREYLQRVRMYLKRKNHDFHYVWVAELQKRGAVHYHLIFWFKKGFKLPHSDKIGWWSHGFTEQKPARKGIGYLMKYTSKCDSVHKFPRGMRIYGASRLIKSAVERVSFYKAPKKIQEKFLSPYGSYFVKVKGGWREKYSNYFFENDVKYALASCVNGGIILCKLNDTGVGDLTGLNDFMVQHGFWVN